MTAQRRGVVEWGMDGQMDGEGEYLFAVKHPHLIDMQVDGRMPGQEGNRNVCCIVWKKGHPLQYPQQPLAYFPPLRNLPLRWLVVIKYS